MSGVGFDRLREVVLEKDGRNVSRKKGAETISSPTGGKKIPFSRQRKEGDIRQRETSGQAEGQGCRREPCLLKFSWRETKKKRP